MDSIMHFQRIGIRTRIGADITLEWLLSSVGSNVPFKITVSRRRIVTYRTLVCFFPCMTFHMYLNIRRKFGRIFTNITFLYSVFRDYFFVTAITVVWTISSILYIYKTLFQGIILDLSNINSVLPLQHSPP